MRSSDIRYFAKRTFISLVCLVILSALMVSGCGSVSKTAREAQYSAYELAGVQKRDLLKDRVDDARDDQKEASESFGDALERLQAFSGFQGGDLEKKYKSLKSSYDDAVARSDDVHKSIRQVETVANDLFAEWEKEIGEIQTASLKSQSQKTLTETRQRYNEMHASLKRSEQRMEPVLSKFNDQVLFLKHNLNAQAVASLKGQVISIQGEIEKLIADMNQSIASADRFIQQMP